MVWEHPAFVTPFVWQRGDEGLIQPSHCSSVLCSRVQGWEQGGIVSIPCGEQGRIRIVGVG